MHDWCDSDSGSDNEKDSNRCLRQQTDCFASSTCFCEMETNLEFALEFASFCL